VTLALHRTPPLYPTDAPAPGEIPSVQAQFIHIPAGNFVRLEWADKTHDSAVLPKAERAWQGPHLVTQSPATDRFSDACAVMIQAKPGSGDLNPSLQMGDADHPVRIFLWDGTRGAAVMEASGRETTKRTGQSFPAQAQYANGKWSVTLQISDMQTGTPFAVAVWNGSQQDRDGRKYFTIWYRAQ
jgi:DMSO reductase family type II enzyme heme b subunit